MSGVVGLLLAFVLGTITLAVFLSRDALAVKGDISLDLTVRERYRSMGGPGDDTPPANSTRAGKYNLTRAGKYNLTRTGKYNLTQIFGPWDPVKRLVEMLLTSLPEGLLPRGGDCDVFFMAGWKHSTEILWPLIEARRRPGSNPRVAFIVNEESPTNEWAWGRYPRKVVPHGVILGNWWNRTLRDYMDENVTSLWVPFGSLSFANRLLSTPMDLTGRRNASQRRRFQACTQRYIDGANLPKTAAYQQRNCRTNSAEKPRPPWENYRELFWDQLNRRMLAELGTRGAALGRCNGEEHLGVKLKLERKHRPCSRPCTHLLDYDQSVVEYAHFKVVLALENTINDGGYITEKLVNALLAGSIPIYAGSSRASDVFRPGSYLSLRPGENDAEVISSAVEVLRNESLYAVMARQEAVSDDVMRRFFSWHPAVWPTYGDSLRRRIVGEMLRHCK